MGGNDEVGLLMWCTGVQDSIEDMTGTVRQRLPHHTSALGRLCAARYGDRLRLVTRRVTQFRACTERASRMHLRGHVSASLGSSLGVKVDLDVPLEPGSRGKFA